jgi:hypothetical protein
MSDMTNFKIDKNVLWVPLKPRAQTTMDSRGAVVSPLNATKCKFSSIGNCPAGA